MSVRVRGEFGYDLALEGLSYNKNQPLDAMPGVAARLAPKDYGHNKFLESIYVWVEVTAPRYWWQEADTYRVGSTKQSQSTMHTILKKPLTQDDFIEDLPTEVILLLNDLIVRKDFQRLKHFLPEGFLQKRMWCVNYKTLRNIIIQRCTHRLPEWQIFVNEIRAQVLHPDLLET